MTIPRLLLLPLLGVTLMGGEAVAVTYEQDVRPFLQKYCIECHGPNDKKGGLAFSDYPDEYALKEMPDIIDVTQWVIEEGEMPPRTASVHPTEEEKEAVIEWMTQTLDALRNASPNDPGLVVMPRLNHREYQRVVNSLTGQEIDVTSILKQDGSAGEGFLNVGQAQLMRVEQFESFLGAAKEMLKYAIPSSEVGLTWAPTPHPSRDVQGRMLHELKRYHAEALDRLLKPIFDAHVGWLRRNGGALANYLEACWRYEHREALGLGRDATFEDVAKTFEQPLFPSSIERLYAMLNWQDLPRDPNAKGIKELGEYSVDSDYMATVIDRTAAPREYVEQNLIFQIIADRWQQLPAPSGQDLEQRQDEIRKIARWYGSLYARSKPDLASGRRMTKKKQERNFMGGFIGTEYYNIDLSKVKGDTLYLMVSTALDGNETDFVVWEEGQVWQGDQSRPWSEVFANSITDQDGNPVRFGFNAKGEPIDPNAIGVQAPSTLKIKLPPSVRKSDLEVQVSLDPQHGMNASTQNRIDDEPVEDLSWLAGNRTLGKLTSQKAALVDGSIGILGDGLRKMEYRALGAYSDEERDWVDNINKDAAQFGALSEIEARAIAVPWPLQYNMPLYHTWPMQFQFPEDYLIMMNEEQKAEYQRLNRLIASMGSPEYLALLEGLRAVGIQEPAAGLFPSVEQFNRLSKEQQDYIRQLAIAMQEDLKQDRAAAAEILAPFMEKAWRGKVDPADVEKVLAFYDRERQQGRHYVNAVRTAMLPVLIHPRFLYRFTPATGEEVAALTDEALASRLSFMIWGTIPDAELLQLAAEGRLRDPQVLQDQIKRMLADPRSDAMASEFMGLWLNFTDFQELVSPDPKRFKTFTDSLKQAMYDETIHFFQYLFQNDQPITDALFAEYTFLNEELAKHYGIEGVKGPQMRKVSTAGTPRGGVLGMGAILTKTSTPLRTSPVIRGHWLYEEVLGIHLPPPPPNVPQLSDDEVSPEGLTVREQLEKHREDPACFSCHDRIDPLGVAMENFDPVGQWRNKDIAGNPVDNQGKFVSSGETLNGLEGLRNYLQAHQEQFVKTFCRKLLAYAIGRQVEITDEPLIEEMTEALQGNEYRPSAALEVLVSSPQFLYQRHQFPDGRNAGVN